MYTLEIFYPYGIYVCIQGDNLDSVETSEIQVTVGGEECTKTSSNLRGSELICTPPLEPPGGEKSTIIQVREYTRRIYNIVGRVWANCVSGL